MIDGASFADDRVAAAREFTHTMIVVDDQANQLGDGQTNLTVSGLRRPGRGHARAAIDRKDTSTTDTKHALNARVLIDGAMNLGLICSVLRPMEQDDFRERVGKAAERADIVCLDWEIREDSGRSAKGIIGDIVRSDATRNGRLRLIAIYTGERDRQRILNEVLSVFTEEERKIWGIKKSANSEVVGRDGLRIIYLFKKHGTQLPEELSDYQVEERELPERLLREFAELSEGILSNVALATIASIRNVAHHVIGKFVGRMDGPYFHHRATIQNPEEAADYAVKIVLSELKSAVDAHRVADRYAGATAIDRRVRGIAVPSDELRLAYVKKGNVKKGNPDKEESFSVGIADAVRLVVDGCKSAHEAINSPSKPSKADFEKGFTSLFRSSDLSEAMSDMREFASLTGVRMHPGSYLCRSGGYVPTLGLGCVVRDNKQQYWLCLQASCDSVRITQNSAFVFAPLYPTDDNPDHVVPVSEDDGKMVFLGLKLEKRAYANMISVVFSPACDLESVKATKVRGKKGLYFRSVGKRRFLWIADLKQRRALRTAQRLGQDMGRIGFDEFEPYRKKMGD